MIQKADFSFLKRSSAEYIAKHGKWALSRGRRPSAVPYKGIMDPSLAFMEANKDFEETMVDGNDEHGPPAPQFVLGKSKGFFEQAVVLRKARLRLSRSNSATFERIIGRLRMMQALLPGFPESVYELASHLANRIERQALVFEGAMRLDENDIPGAYVLAGGCISAILAVAFWYDDDDTLLDFA